MLDAYLYDGLRTPFGRYGGALSGVRPDDLAGALMPALLARSGVPAQALEDVILGCTNQAGEDSRNVARNALLAAGLPWQVPGQTVNRLCASGLAAVIDAARAITAGEGELYLAGGVESMSRAPFVLGKAEGAFSRRLEVHDSTIGARFANPRLVSTHGGHSMPQTADLLAREMGIERDAADRFALASQARYQAALAAGFFDDEIAPVTLPRPVPVTWTWPGWTGKRRRAGCSATTTAALNRSTARTSSACVARCRWAATAWSWTCACSTAATPAPAGATRSTTAPSARCSPTAARTATRWAWGCSA